MRATRRWRRGAQVMGIALALALVASACGDDDDDSGAAATTSGATSASTGGSGTGATGATGSTTPATTKPVPGGEMTLLMSNELANQLDPVNDGNGSGADYMRTFPIYGAIVMYNDAKNAIEPYFADSVTSSADFKTWTIKLKPNIKFTDGTAYDANAIMVNWTRTKDPANRSPGLVVAGNLASMTVKDPLTLEAVLTAPNSTFPTSISRYGAMNNIASPTAISGGVDLKSKPVGAGPFTLGEWVRDDHMTLVKNPTFIFAPEPYLDKVTIRTVIDENQRYDTFKKGDADADYTASGNTLANAEKDGFNVVRIGVGVGGHFAFNTSKAPMDDVRLRRAFLLGVDRAALVSAAIGPGAKPETTWGRVGTFWDSPEAKLPAFNKAEAQKLIDEVVKEKGGPVKMLLQTSAGNVKVAEFVQTQLNSLNNVQVEVNTLDFTGLITNVFQGNYEISVWGVPYLDPEPGLYASLHSGPSNFSKYANPQMDALLESARLLTDNKDRLEVYKKVWALALVDLPYSPYVQAEYGTAYTDEIQDFAVWEDGIIRFDKIWMKAG